MAKLVGQGAKLLQRAVVVGQDARLVHAGHTHAESATAFALAHLGVDPAVIKGALG